jgi:hypothetical protein
MVVRALVPWSRQVRAVEPSLLFLEGHKVGCDCKSLDLQHDWMVAGVPQSQWRAIRLTATMGALFRIDCWNSSAQIKQQITLACEEAHIDRHVPTSSATYLGLWRQQPSEHKQSQKVCSLPMS